MDPKLTKYYRQALQYVQENPNMSFDSVQGELEDMGDEIKGLKGQDVASGLLGYFLKGQLGPNFDISPNKLTYSPNDSSSYFVEAKPGDIKIGGSWEF